MQAVNRIDKFVSVSSVLHLLMPEFGSFAGIRSKYTQGSNKP